MDIKLFTAGLAMGLAIAAPLGPVNIIVIREALARGAAAALIVGCGAVAADSFFASIAAFGLGSVVAFLGDHARLFGGLGGIILVTLGVITARSQVLWSLSERFDARPWHAALAAFTTTMTNPGALIGVFAVFAGMDGVLQLADGPWRPPAAVLAFTLGGFLWWLLLGSIVSRLKNRLSEVVLNRLNRWTGVLIAAFGFAVLMEVFG